MKYFSLLFIFINFSAQAMLTKPILITDEPKVDAIQPWMELGHTDEERVIKLLKILKKSRTGNKILTMASEKASEHGETLVDIIKPGEVSITDTTLTRRFSPKNPNKIIYETHSKVFVDRGHRILDAVLDLAHELTHYNYKNTFNPYMDNFNLKTFVNSTVEGKGGEVEAYLVECQVYHELYPERIKFNSNCHLVWDESANNYSKVKGVKEFYRLGKYLKDFMHEVKDFGHDPIEFPELARAQANFISSAYGLPYPLAAVREYRTIMDRVCQNDSDRLLLLKNRVGREIASVESSRDKLVYKKLSQQFQKRCNAF